MSKIGKQVKPTKVTVTKAEAERAGPSLRGAFIEHVDDRPYLTTTNLIALVRTPIDGSDDDELCDGYVPREALEQIERGDEAFVTSEEEIAVGKVPYLPDDGPADVKMPPRARYNRRPPNHGRDTMPDVARPWPEPLGEDEGRTLVALDAAQLKRIADAMGQKDGVILELREDSMHGLSDAHVYHKPIVIYPLRGAVRNSTRGLIQPVTIHTVPER